MGAVLLLVLYLATSLVLAAFARAMRYRATLATALMLTLLPLAFTAGGFWREKVVAPTVTLAGVAPWASQALAEELEAGSSPRNPLLLDPLVQFEPWRRAAREDWLFNPAQGAGAALLANGQSAVMFPLEVMAHALSPVRAATFLQAARLLVAAWGMFLLARRLAIGQTAATLAAAAYLGGGFLQIWRAHPHSAVAAMAPWIVFAAVDLVRRPRPAAAILLAVCGAFALFAGHPETLLHVVLLAALVAVPALLARRRRILPALGWSAAAAVLSFLLAAPMLLPFVENLLVSAEWEKRQFEPAQQVEVSAGEALTRLAPAASFHLLGDPFEDNWIGPENLAELGGGSVGAAALVLLPLAFARARRRRMAAGWLVVGTVGLLVGSHVPWISKPFGWIPLLNTTLLKRLSLWWVLAAAVLVGLAVEALLTARRDARKKRNPAPFLIGLALSGVAGFFALLLGLVLTLTGGSLPEGAFAEPAFGGELGIALLAGLFAVGLALHRNHGAPQLGGTRGSAWPWWATLCLAGVMTLLVLPRAAVFARWVPLSSSFTFYPVTDAVRFVQARATGGWRVAGLDAALVPHSAAFFGLEEVRAYDPMTFAPYERFASRLGEKPHAGWQRVLEARNPALTFLGTRYVIAHPGMGELPGVELVYAGPDAVVYENQAALPRLFAPKFFRPFDDSAQALDAAMEISDFVALASVDAATLPPGAELGSPSSVSAAEIVNGEVSVSSLQIEPSGRVSAMVTAEAPALVATSQPAIPGWRLVIDDQRAEPVRVNGAFLGAWVEAGQHAIEFRYAPASWRWGWMLCAAGFLAMAALVNLGSGGFFYRRHP